MSLVQHICKFFCFGCYVQNLFFNLLAFILWYQLILCFFEAFQFYARTSHPLKKVRLEKSGSLFLGQMGSCRKHLLGKETNSNKGHIIRQRAMQLEIFHFITTSIKGRKESLHIQIVKK